MEPTTSDNAPVYTKTFPASEQESLCSEAADPAMERLSFIGITATSDGPEGLFVQCAWFDDDKLDWFWVHITDVRSLAVWQDPQFRGGAPGVWMSTNIAEYAMVTLHAAYEQMREDVPHHLRAPRNNIWPQQGLAPAWWPERSISLWLHNRAVWNRYKALLDEDPLVAVTLNLSLGASTTWTAWPRQGPKGDIQLPGRPPNYLSQMSTWVLAPDAGMRKTRAVNLAQGEEDDGARKGTGEGKGKGKGKQQRSPDEVALKCGRYGDCSALMG